MAPKKPVLYKKTKHQNIYKQCNLFVCQLGKAPKFLRFRHEELKKVLAWRDETRLQLEDQKRRKRFEVQQQRDDHMKQMLLGSCRGRGRGCKTGFRKEVEKNGRGKPKPKAAGKPIQRGPRTGTGNVRKPKPKAAGKPFQTPPRIGTVSVLKRGIRGKREESTVENGKSPHGNGNTVARVKHQENVLEKQQLDQDLIESSSGEEHLPEHICNASDETTAKSIGVIFMAVRSHERPMHAARLIGQLLDNRVGNTTFQFLGCFVSKDQVHEYKRVLSEKKVDVSFVMVGAAGCGPNTHSIMQCVQSKLLSGLLGFPVIVDAMSSM